MRRIGDTLDTLGESPVWSATEQTLTWVDIRGARVRRLEADGTVLTWQTPEIVGSVGLTSSRDKLILGLKTRIALFDTAAKTFTSLAAPEAEKENHRFNDGRCDPWGRFWCGSMNDMTRAPVGTLYRFGGSETSKVRTAVGIPNSLCFSPGGRCAYFGDSTLGEIIRA